MSFTRQSSAPKSVLPDQHPDSLAVILPDFRHDWTQKDGISRKSSAGGAQMLPPLRCCGCAHWLAGREWPQRNAGSS